MTRFYMVANSSSGIPPKKFIDSSFFKALVDYDDEFHPEAEVIWKQAEEEGTTFVTTNFVLDETYTLIRARKGKDMALQLRKDIIDSMDAIRIERVGLKDEAEAWKFFKKLPGRGVSFTDCTSFALMKRLGLKEAFTFDKDFRKAGFKILP